jgi:hypothetical protein
MVIEVQIEEGETNYTGPVLLALPRFYELTPPLTWGGKATGKPGKTPADIAGLILEGNSEPLSFQALANTGFSSETRVHAVSVVEFNYPARVVTKEVVSAIPNTNVIDVEALAEAVQEIGVSRALNALNKGHPVELDWPVPCPYPRLTALDENNKKTVFEQVEAFVHSWGTLTGWATLIEVESIERTLPNTREKSSYSQATLKEDLAGYIALSHLFRRLFEAQPSDWPRIRPLLLALWRTAVLPLFNAGTPAAFTPPKAYQLADQQRKQFFIPYARAAFYSSEKKAYLGNFARFTPFLLPVLNDFAPFAQSLYQFLAEAEKGEPLCCYFSQVPNPNLAALVCYAYHLLRPQAERTSNTAVCLYCQQKFHFSPQGRPRKYCSTECAHKADNVKAKLRVARWRKTQRGRF